jgi:hypothetical protein
MRKILSTTILGFLLAASSAYAAESKIVEHNRLMDHGDGHLMDMEGGMVMGQNKDKLPAGCDRVSEDVHITVHAGRKYSKDYPGTIFGFDKHEWRIKPCTRLTVTFVNEDNVRHQWMMHGLPKFMYDKGMFHLEITGPAKIAGTLILPSEDRTYLVHCDIAQHMEKGMKAELIVGKGSGTFPSIPGITDPAIADYYGAGEPPPLPAATAAPAPAATASPPTGESFFSGSLILGLVGGLIAAPFLLRRAEQRCQGMNAFACAYALFMDLVNGLVQLLIWLYKTATGKTKFLPKG